MHNYIDPQGLQSIIAQKCSRCGPDITEALKELLRKLKRDFNSYSWIKKKWQCAILDEIPFDAGSWDVHELDPWARTSLVTPNCPSMDCLQTAGVNGRCHYSADINYALFGFMTKLCDDPWWTVSIRIRAWKRIYHPIEGARQITIDWAKAGYNELGSIPNTSEDLSQCDKCPDCYHGSFSYHWDTWRFVDPRRR